MSNDDERGPVFKRAARLPDRDIYTAKTPRGGVPLPVWEDTTARYEAGECDEAELYRKRARRTTTERVENVEKRVDGLALSVKGVETKVDTLLTMAVRADEARERATAAEATALERQAVKDSEALAAKRKHTIALISALAAALALLLATWLVKS